MISKIGTPNSPTDLARYVIGICFLLANFRSPASFGKEPPKFEAELHSGDGWALVAPRGWRKMVMPGLDLFLSGDGIYPMPLMDDSFSPVRIGIVIDRKFPDKFQLHDLPAWLEKQSSGDKDTTISKIEEVKLLTGINGRFVSMRIIKDEGRRLSVYQMLIWLDRKGKAISMAAYINVARDSQSFLKKSGLLEFLRGHLFLLGEEAEDISVKLPQYLYDGFNSQLSPAIYQAYKANDLVLEGKWDESITLFQEALEKFEPIHGAHNGLAWALMKRNKSKKDLKMALVHAKRAVELTGGLSDAAMDTLKEVQEAQKRK